MRRGTTPTFTYDVDADLTGWDVYATFEQEGVEITRKPVDMEPTEGGSTCSVELTQEDTLLFHEGRAKTQLRAIKDGVAVASTIFSFDVGEILLNGQIPQEV